MRTHTMRPRADRENGAALVMALWAMIAMGLLVAGVRILGLREARLAEARLEQGQLSALADGMINLTMLRLLDEIPGGHPPIDGTLVPVLFGGMTGAVQVQDESGKIDLNQAPEAALQRYLLAQNVDFEAAQGLADKIMDWREPGIGRRLNGAKAEDYRRAGYAYGPRGGRMESVDELRLVMGMTQTLFERLAPGLTVVSQTAWPDQAVAPPKVLRALDGMDDERIAALLAARAARLITAEDGSIADSAPPPAVGRAFSIDARVTGRTEAVQRHALLRLTGIPAAPYVVYQWR
jgi:general secretion pathway protein K